MPFAWGETQPLNFKGGAKIKKDEKGGHGGDNKCVQSLVGISHKKRSLGTPRHTWRDKWIFKKSVCVDVSRTELIQYTVHGSASCYPGTRKHVYTYY